MQHRPDRSPTPQDNQPAPAHAPAHASGDRGPGTPAARRAHAAGANDAPRSRTPWREPVVDAAGPTNPDPGMPLDDVRLAIGRFVGAHGVRGQVKLEIFTDEPDRLTQLRRVYFDDDDTPHPVKSVKLHGRQALFNFPHITNRDAAEELRGTLVRIAGSQARPPEEGEFFHYQLIGLHVYLEDGTELGTLAEILGAGEVDVYVVRDARGNEQLFPALKDVVLEIDPAADRVIVRPQQWEPEPQRERTGRKKRNRSRRSGTAGSSTGDDSPADTDASDED